jgi:hypothetical protein
MSKFVHLLCALLVTVPLVHAATDDNDHHDLPASIDVQDDLRHQMILMLQRSPTFRQQCQRLDVPELHIQIRTDAQLIDRPFRARSTIHRSESGELTVSVAITAFGDPTEWLAHELEHIIEQLDGVRVPQLALAGNGDAWPTGDGMFETARAMRVGRLVRREVHHGDRTLARAAAAVEIAARRD